MVIREGEKFNIVQKNNIIGKSVIKVEITKVNKKSIRYKMNAGCGWNEYKKPLDEFISKYAN